MNHLRCGCEDGRDCTKTTVCHVETAVEDYEYEVARLRALLQRMWDEFPYEDSAELARQELYGDEETT